MSSLPSFFLPPQAFHDQVVTIREPDVIRQMRKVFRMKPGDVFLALDGARHEYTCVIDAWDRTVVRAIIQHVAESARETRVSLLLYPSLIRRERFATILEKCTELGVASFLPIAASRSPYQDISPHLRGRWAAIIRESAEVAHRGVLPPLASVAALSESLARIPKNEPIIVLSTAQEDVKTANDIPSVLKNTQRIHLFLGPEGDYTEEEYQLFSQYKATPFSLGSRIVRSETAAIAAVVLFSSLQ